MNTIRHDNAIESAAGDGRVPFISADEIAQVAFNSLIAETVENHEPYILGPELLSYNQVRHFLLKRRDLLSKISGQVAEMLSEVLGRKIIHKRLSEAEAVKFWENFGVENKYSKQLARLDLDISKGEYFLRGANAVYGIISKIIESS